MDYGSWACKLGWVFRVGAGQGYVNAYERMVTSDGWIAKTVGEEERRKPDVRPSIFRLPSWFSFLRSLWKSQNTGNKKVGSPTIRPLALSHSSHRSQHTHPSPFFLMPPHRTVPHVTSCVDSWYWIVLVSFCGSFIRSWRSQPFQTVPAALNQPNEPVEPMEWRDVLHFVDTWFVWVSYVSWVIDEHERREGIASVFEA